MSLFQRAIASLCCLLGLGAIGHEAIAEPASVADVWDDDGPRKEPRTIMNTTAWVPEAAELNFSLGMDQELRPTGGLSVGLGDIAEVGLQLQHERSECDPCEDPSKDATILNVASAFFKMGTPEGFVHTHTPALALVFRKALLQEAQYFTDNERPLTKPLRETRGAMLTAMASKTLGPAALHLGAELLVSSGTMLQGDFGVDEAVVRPALAAEWTPAKYPLSTFMVDVRWVSELEDTGGASREWDTRMSAAWGVRYQALNWASVDLNVRRQNGQGLGNALVTFGVRGHFDISNPGGKSGTPSLTD